MKWKYLAPIASMLFILLAAGSCKKDEIIDDGSGGNDEPETSITFKCVDDSINLDGVLVGITPNQSDRDNGVFLYSGTSNSLGKVKFDNLSALTYYYSATYSPTSGIVVRKGQITLEENDEVDRDINF